MILHPDYDGFLLNDYAIIKLESSAMVNGVGEPTGLGTVQINRDASNPMDSQSVRAIGFGRTALDEPGSPVLLEAFLSYVNDDNCEDVWGETLDPDVMICANDDSGKGICPGTVCDQQFRICSTRRFLLLGTMHLP